MSCVKEQLMKLRAKETTSTLQAYDRLLWDAMRSEHLRRGLWTLRSSLMGVEDTVVIHADQVPCWLSSGMLRQLYGVC